MTYTTKPRRAEAIQFTGTNHDEITAFAGQENVRRHDHGLLSVKLSGPGWRDMAPGDWVIKDLADGWMHPASPETFNRVWGQE